MTHSSLLNPPGSTPLLSSSPTVPERRSAAGSRHAAVFGPRPRCPCTMLAPFRRWEKAFLGAGELPRVCTDSRVEEKLRGHWVTATKQWVMSQKSPSLSFYPFPTLKFSHWQLHSKRAKRTKDHHRDPTSVTSRSIHVRHRSWNKLRARVLSVTFPHAPWRHAYILIRNSRAGIPKYGPLSVAAGAVSRLPPVANGSGQYHFFVGPASWQEHVWERTLGEKLCCKEKSYRKETAATWKWPWLPINRVK